MFLGPNIGDKLSEVFEDESNYNSGVSDVMCIVNFVWFVLLFLFNGFIYVFKEHHEFEKKLKVLTHAEEEEEHQN